MNTTKVGALTLATITGIKDEEHDRFRCLKSGEVSMEGAWLNVMECGIWMKNIVKC